MLLDRHEGPAEMGAGTGCFSNDVGASMIRPGVGVEGTKTLSNAECSGIRNENTRWNCWGGADEIRKDGVRQRRAAAVRTLVRICAMPA